MTLVCGRHSTPIRSVALFRLDHHARSDLGGELGPIGPGGRHPAEVGVDPTQRDHRLPRLFLLYLKLHRRRAATFRLHTHPRDVPEQADGSHPVPGIRDDALRYRVPILVLLSEIHDLHATITDTLPLSVTLDETAGGTLALPGGTVVLPDRRVAVTWTPVITAPGGLWMGTILVTVNESYAGPLTNLVEATTEEGVTGDDSVTVIASRLIYLPLVMRST